MARMPATLTGLLLAVVATGLVARSAEGAAIDRSTLYEFNDCTGIVCMATSIQTTPADEARKEALQDVNKLLKLNDTGTPTILNDPNSDYHLRPLEDDRVVLNPLMNPNQAISPDNPLTGTITFEIGWYGTVQGVPVPSGSSETIPELLFLLTAIRQGSTGPVDPAIDSGYIRNSSVAIDGVNAMEGIISDCLVVDPVTCGPSFVGDNNSGFNEERYLGFLTELRAPTGGTPGGPFTEADLDYVSFSIGWALMQPPIENGGNFQLVNSGYIVPEPGVILLLGAGALFLTRRRRA